MTFSGLKVIQDFSTSGCLENFNIIRCETNYSFFILKPKKFAFFVLFFLFLVLLNSTDSFFLCAYISKLNPQTSAGPRYFYLK